MISVLMSVYNEEIDEIRLSVDSILAQTYADFELIIVLDQPNYAEGLSLLHQYAEQDKRVKILVNETNIGLALSMNYAAEHACGEFLLRMDADDICLPDRFQLEYDAISCGRYDLICGNYDFIDENGNLLSQKPAVYTDRQLNALLPYRNIIHHPTVIMTAQIFREVGGYRNYPCAQDYDLWLRMKCAGCRMHMMPEKLIQYRVRQASTTVQKRYKQSCTGDYIRGLYHQKDRMSGYSYESYQDYLDKRGVNDPAANADFIENSNRYMQAKQELSESQYYRPNIVTSMKIALLTKMCK